MSINLKSKLKELGKCVLNALAAGLTAWFATITTGCTTVITPSDEAPTVSVTGAVPIGLQLNMKKDTTNN